jgi:hypothetical protein
VTIEMDGIIFRNFEQAEKYVEAMHHEDGTA